MPARELHAFAVDAKLVRFAEVAAVPIVRNALAVVTAALMPVAVLGLPVVRAILLPGSLLLLCLLMLLLR